MELHFRVSKFPGWPHFVAVIGGRVLAADTLSAPAFCSDEPFVLYRNEKEIAKGLVSPVPGEDPAFLFDMNFGRYGRHWDYFLAAQLDDGDNVVIKPNEAMVQSGQVPENFVARYWAGMCGIDQLDPSVPLYMGTTAA